MDCRCDGADVLDVHDSLVTSPDEPLQPILIQNYAHAFIWPAWQAFALQSLLVALAMIAVASISFFCSVVLPSAMVSTAVAMAPVDPRSVLS